MSVVPTNDQEKMGKVGRWATSSPTDQWLRSLTTAIQPTNPSGKSQFCADAAAKANRHVTLVTILDAYSETTERLHD